MLVDFQPLMFHGIGSGDRTKIYNGAVALSRAAQILDIPTVLTAISPDINKPVISEIADLFPKTKVIDRKAPGFDAFTDREVFMALKKSGRKKLVTAGLWTSMCFAFTALRALSEGYEVYGVMDISGDATHDAYEYGVKRMVQAGVIPVTWMSTVSEWIRGWDHPKSRKLTDEVYSRYDKDLYMLYNNK